MGVIREITKAFVTSDRQIWEDINVATEHQKYIDTIEGLGGWVAKRFPSFLPGMGECGDSEQFYYSHQILHILVSHGHEITDVLRGE